MIDIGSISIPRRPALDSDLPTTGEVLVLAPLPGAHGHHIPAMLKRVGSAHILSYLGKSRALPGSWPTNFFVPVNAEDFSC